MNIPNTNEIFFVCTEGLVTSVTGAEALKDALVSAGVMGVAVRHIQVSWLPSDAKLVLCHENLKGDVQKKVPHASIVTVTDFLHAPEYAEVAKALLEARND